VYLFEEKNVGKLYQRRNAQYIPNFPTIQYINEESRSMKEVIIEGVCASIKNRICETEKGIKV
jgi:hypothetical protein